MRVLRVEHPSDNKGPFQHSWHDDQAGYKKMGKLMGFETVLITDDLTALLFGSYVAIQPNADHPHHFTDVPPTDEDDEHEWRVGVQSEELLEHWFNREVRLFLSTKGYMLSIYECHHYRLGTYQMLFCIDDAILVERKPLDAD